MNWLDKQIRKMQIIKLGLSYKKPEINERLRCDGSLNFQAGACARSKYYLYGICEDENEFYFKTLKND